MRRPSPSSNSSGANKTEVVQAIAGALAATGVPLTLGEGTDLAIKGEFFNAAWGIGRKKITYEAAILADEVSRTVLMWEKTLEEGSGLSFRAEGTSFVQTGKTLFRRIKGVHYGVDGVAHEYDLDIGTLPRTVKKPPTGWAGDSAP